MDKEVPGTQVGMEDATCVDVDDGLNRLPTPCGTLLSLDLRVVVDIVLEITVARLVEEDAIAVVGGPEVFHNPRVVP